jgi:hypothetical protein
MRTLSLVAVTVLASALLVAVPAKADDIPTSDGNTASGFTEGQSVSSALFAATNGTQAAPFSAACGSDSGAAGSTNCSATWIFNYTVPTGDTITGATLTIGIVDIDSKAAGDQVASFILDGADDLTGLLNTVANGLNGGVGSPNNQYNTLTISIPGTDLADLSGTSATFALTLASPGLGALGNSPSNGAGLVFSTLDITATPGSMPPPPPVPEPATWVFLLTGIAAIGAKALVSR